MRAVKSLLGGCLALTTGRAAAQERTDPPPQYAAAVRALEPFVAAEVREKQLPALSIALVDDQQTVWAAGFGFRDPQTKAPATAATVYRVGSVSKLFTDLAVMRLVEQGALNLDAPVTDYLPDFRPNTPSAKPPPLPPLMASPAAPVREPPAGNYFARPSRPAGTPPPLAMTVESLNRTSLVLEPGAKTKY